MTRNSAPSSGSIVFAEHKSLRYGTWIVAIISHTQINTRNPPSLYPCIDIM